MELAREEGKCDVRAAVDGGHDPRSKTGKIRVENVSEGPDNLDFLFNGRLY
jgi:hypothetical protein